MKILRRAALTAVAVAAFLPTTLVAQPVYVASSWNQQSVHLLNSNMSLFSSFRVNDSNPNGVASNGSLIFTGHFLNASIVAYNTSGVEQYRFSDSRLSGLQGLTMVGSEIAAAANGSTHFFNALTGAFTRSFANSGGTVEALGFDGSLIWELGSTIIGRDAVTGTVVRSFANAASGCGFGGTGIAARGDGVIALGCTDGSWSKVSDVDGSVLSSGNNGIEMYGLDALGTASVVPEPGTYALMTAGLAMLGVVARRRRTR